MAIRVFLVETQDLVPDAVVCLLAEQMPCVTFDVFDRVTGALRAAPCAELVLICAGKRLLEGADAGLLQQVLLRQPQAMLMMLRGAADLLALRGVLDRLAGAPLLRRAAAPAADVQPPGEAPGGPQPRLSQRECEILLLLQQGLQNKVIARRLDLSVSTVKTHVANIFRKIGAANRLDAICKYNAQRRPAPGPALMQGPDPLDGLRLPVLGGRTAAMFLHHAA